ncbi:hypothetical protein AG1IA_08263 [Rhizoctonia solani AG-1 IA]|uniref:Glutamate--cysteine ligase n=1 Tax=Thanatephorus cucumeris (strain AG1-IA) TaxID=983506 RepID=L8WHL6_THACA|nr:hypothetical protein AG1IA_08263 [Rhizoctonia solani AG-1 IA]
MGLLFLGTPLSWEEGKKHADYIREHGITQFLNVWRKLKDREGDTLLWGDEVRSSIWLFHMTMTTRMPDFPCVRARF